MKAIIITACMLLCQAVMAQPSRVNTASAGMSPVKTPRQFTLFTEEVPLHIPDVFERFDRQLLANQYMNSYIFYMLKLSTRYMPMIEERLKANGVPDDFKYLCVAESALQNAISKVGATGFWQFMKGTAPGYGLIVNSEVDQRYDPLLATDAACKYLKTAYNKFGNWTAAAASYNCGMGGYNSAATLQGTTNYYQLLLPAETMQYMFRIAALKYILEQPQLFGFELDAADRYYPENLRVVAVDKPIPSLVTFARQNNTDYKTIRLLNPWLRSNRLSSTYGGRLKIYLPQ